MANCHACGRDVPAEAKFCPDCGAELGAALAVSAAMETVSGFHTQPPEDLDIDSDKPTPTEAVIEAGTIIAGKFKIERLIGQGGMGRVFKAIETLSGHAVAIKIIAAKYVASEKAVERFIAEGVTTRGLSHPNIVQVYDIGLHEDQPYMAMEFIDGEALHVWRGRKLAQNKNVPVATARQIINALLEGLEVAHSAGIVHRDLKPENIMLIGEPTPQSAKIKIVDFGIALATKTATQSSTGTGLGTQLYMAPEQVRNANSANAAADLYSVSKVFYELIVGVLPTGFWQPPSDGRADVPKGVDDLIHRGMSSNRDSRPQSASEYRSLMDAAFEGRIATTGDARKNEIKAAQADLRNAYIRMFQTMPKWAWWVIGFVVFCLIADAAGWLDEGY